MHRYLIAPDSFKGTMSSSEVCLIIEQAILEAEPDALVEKVAVADGGEGLVDAYLSMFGGERIWIDVTGPLFKPVRAFWGLLPDGQTAVIEMAAAAGLPLLSAAEKNPEQTTTLGVGELVMSAINHGVKKIVLGLGGSATNDGGIGLASALGYRFLDAAGRDLLPTGSSLLKISRIVPPAASPLPAGLEIEAACDVSNPLLGLQGAAHVFAPQKGADPGMVERLDQGLANLAVRIAADLAIDVLNVPGGGAAGGLGAGVVAFLGGRLRPGIELMLDAADFDRKVQDADFVITGEGRMDGQTLSGKAPVGVVRRAKRYQVPVIGIVGSLGGNADALYEIGFTTIISTIRELASLEDTLGSCRQDLAAAVKAVVRLINAR